MVDLSAHLLRSFECVVIFPYKSARLILIILNDYYKSLIEK